MADRADADAWWGRLTGLRDVEDCSGLFAERR
jgi:hypothetical protein